MPSEANVKRAEELVETVEREIAGYHLHHTRDAESDEALSIVDALTPPGEMSIRLGKEEVGYLADHVAGELLRPLAEALDAAEQRGRESAEAELGRLRERIEKEAGREYLVWERVCSRVRERHDYAYRVLREVIAEHGASQVPPAAPSQEERAMKTIEDVP